MAKKVKKIRAPKGFHFMKKGKSVSIMKHTGKFKRHKGASLTIDIPLIKEHRK